MTTSIFDLSSPTSPDPRLHISHSSIPQSYLDPSQPTTRRSPYRQINNTPFLRSVQICIPSNLHATLFPRQSSPQSLPSSGHDAKYAKVILSLRDILENEPLRKGNYILLSSPVDSTVRILLQRGTLTLIMPQQVYQRSGLTFPSTKLQSGGRKHEKNSALQKIEVDLRQPAMTKGRKGFDRLMYAAKNVDGLREARVCLCVDLDQQLADFGATRGKKRKRDDIVKSGKMADQNDVDMSAPTATESNTTSNTSSTDTSPNNHVLASHHHTHVTDHGITALYADVLVPPIFTTLSILAHSCSNHNHRTSKTSLHSSSTSPITLEDDMHETIEYLSLLFLESPQLTKQQYGKTDMFLSQYRLSDPSLSLSLSLSELKSPDDAQQQPSPPPPQECNGVELPPGTNIQDLQITTYEGLISSDWVVQTVIDLIRRSRVAEAQALTEDAWVVVKAVAHEVEPVGGKDGYLIVLCGAAENDTIEDKEDEDEDEEIEGGDMLADREEGSLAAEEMDRDGKPRQEETETGRREANLSVRGFSSVTCFEFIGSFN